MGNGKLEQGTAEEAVSCPQAQESLMSVNESDGSRAMTYDKRLLHVGVLEE